MLAKSLEAARRHLSHAETALNQFQHTGAVFIGDAGDDLSASALRRNSRLRAVSLAPNSL